MCGGRPDSTYTPYPSIIMVILAVIAKIPPMKKYSLSTLPVEKIDPLVCLSNRRSIGNSSANVDFCLCLLAVVAVGERDHDRDRAPVSTDIHTYMCIHVCTHVYTCM